MSTIHEKIQERKDSSLPISYNSNTANVLEKSDLEKRIVAGYGSVWGAKNSHSEMFKRGAFAKSISDLGPTSNSKYKLKFRDEHGRAVALFEDIKEDDTGVYFRTKPLDNVKWADDMLTQLKSRTIDNFSIGFRPIWDKASWDEKEKAIIYEEVRLMEISAVSIPSDIKTFAVRSIETHSQISADVEQFIEDLPRQMQLEARKIFTRCMSLRTNESLDEIKKVLEESKPTKSGFDYDSLIKKLNKQ